MNSDNLHPVELSSQVIDSGIVNQPLNRFTQELTEIDDGLAIVESFSHCWIQKTEEGLVCIDASGPQTGKAVVESMRAWSQDPVHTLVYTHGHIDHVGGSGAFFADVKDKGVSPPKVVAHEGVIPRFERYRMTNGWNSFINKRQFGGIRPLANFGLGNTVENFVPKDVAEPDQTYRDQLSMKVGNWNFELRHARGETDDHTWVWDPDNKAVFAGDFVAWVFPNAGNPQKVQRYPIEWAAAMREMLAVGAEKIYPAHGLPIVGRKRVEQVLGDIAESLEHLADSTLKLMNEGATLDQIIHEVKLPDHLQEQPWLAPQYDEPEFVVRNVYRQFGGWWDGNAANLKPAPEQRVAKEMVQLAGSVEALIDRALEVTEAGDLRLACHLIELAVTAEPIHEGAHRARAEIYWRRRAEERSLMSKGIYASAARQSEAVFGEETNRKSMRSRSDK